MKTKVDKLNLLREKTMFNYWTRILTEFLFAFILIFTINFGITLGEIRVPVFEVIYNVNFVMALWIGSWTFIAFLFSRKTTISANFVNLVINYKNEEIERDEFWGSALSQFIGGMFAAFFVFGLCYSIDMIDGNIMEGTSQHSYVMGGTTPKLKGLFFSNPDIYGYIAWDPTSANIWINEHRYGFAAIQGMVCAFSIIFIFITNTIVDRKFNNQSIQLSLRYIILIVSISLTTIMYANTTNWVRLLAPAIIGTMVDSAIDIGDKADWIWTTLIFISVQIIGLLVVTFIPIGSREEKVIKQEEQ